MKKRILSLFIGLVYLSCHSVLAQKIIPYSFRQTVDSRNTAGTDGSLKVYIDVVYAPTTSLRLYFNGTVLGDESYLLLEALDGAKQEIRQKDLINWCYSSAYFNGNSVKVALYSAPGEQNTIQISAIKVNEGQVEKTGIQEPSANRNNARLASTTNTTVPDLNAMPYAKAVGRFTNGTSAHGTGWIAPNGAIVTSHDVYYYYIKEGYDIIEFNVPASNANGTVNHPSPQDQYPVQGSMALGSEHIDFKDGGTRIEYANWAVMRAMPNSTGLLPGERQQEYFRIARNPGNFTINAMGGVPVEIFHYGNRTADHANGKNKTLQVSQASLLEQNTHLSTYSDGSRDQFLVYTMDIFQGSESGAPITYEESNVAIGIHNKSQTGLPSYGLGFRNDGLRNGLKNAFSPKALYVDVEGLYDQDANGEIDKPYRTVVSGASHAQSGAVVYIAKGYYQLPVTISTPMTLRAPVGKVIIGTTGSNARKAVSSPAPKALLMDNPVAFDRIGDDSNREVSSYPNPFQDHTDIQYRLSEKKQVVAKVYDLTGMEVVTLADTSNEAGIHTVRWDGKGANGAQLPAGMYIIRCAIGNQITNIKVIKK